VAYVMSRFPKITETFVLFEMLALEELGHPLEVFPLLREHEPVSHPEAIALTARAHYGPFLSWAVLRSNARALARAPGAYLGTLLALVRHLGRSLNFLGGALALFPRCVHMAEEMRRLGVGHVHAHFANHPAAAALVVHRLTGIPFSFTAHGSDLHVDQTGLAWKLAQASFAVTVSEYNRAFVRERLGEAAAARVQVIHCGVDPELHARVAEPPPGDLEILCVAALREVKGHRFLLEACAALRARGVGLRCHLVGGGPLEAELRARVKALGLDALVRFHGPQPRAEVLAHMRAAHVLVLASVLDRQGRREGIPVTLMEAMSCALPVVASRISGIPELVEDGRSGLLVPPGDAQALAAALERLAGDPELRGRLGRGGRARVERDFDLQAGARRLSERIEATPRPAPGAGSPS